jgi:hypothetical protein
LDPSITPGDFTVREVGEITEGVTVYSVVSGGCWELGSTGVPPDSQTKFTTDPAVNPVPMI